jgi:hypothetical protein
MRPKISDVTLIRVEKYPSAGLRARYDKSNATFHSTIARALVCS